MKQTAGMALGLILGGVAILVAAEPSGNSEENTKDARLREVLREWANQDRSPRIAHYTFTLTDNDILFNRKTTTRSEGWVLKGCLVRIDMEDAGGKLSPRYLFGTHECVWYDHVEKTAVVYRRSDDGRLLLPSPPTSSPSFIGRWWNGLLLSADDQMCLLFLTVPPPHLEDRYKVTLAKEDDSWVYLDIHPPTPGDFNRVRVVLNRKTFQLRLLWREDVDGSTLYLGLPVGRWQETKYHGGYAARPPHGLQAKRLPG
jgi:hypothetical protein